MSIIVENYAGVWFLKSVLGFLSYTVFARDYILRFLGYCAFIQHLGFYPASRHIIQHVEDVRLVADSLSMRTLDQNFFELKKGFLSSFIYTFSHLTAAMLKNSLKWIFSSGTRPKSLLIVSLVHNLSVCFWWTEPETIL